MQVKVILPPRALSAFLFSVAPASAGGCVGCGNGNGNGNVGALNGNGNGNGNNARP